MLSLHSLRILSRTLSNAMWVRWYRHGHISLWFLVVQDKFGFTTRTHKTSLMLSDLTITTPQLIYISWLTQSPMETWQRTTLTLVRSPVLYLHGSVIIPDPGDAFGSCQDLPILAIAIFLSSFGPWTPFLINSTSSLFSSFQYQHHKSLNSTNRLDAFTTSTSPHLIAILQLH
jgi:hypothetical protein